MTRRSRLVFLCFSLFVGLVCARLGFWQLDRLRQRRASNARVLATRELAPVDLDSGSMPDSVLADRKVRASGSYDFDGQFVIRRQSIEGLPAVRIVTSLRPAVGDTAVLVIRGLVPSPDAASVELDSLGEPGPQRVEGIALGITAQPGWRGAGRGRRSDHVVPAGSRGRAEDASLPRPQHRNPAKQRFIPAPLSPPYRTGSAGRRAAPELRGAVVWVWSHCRCRRDGTDE